MKGVLRTAVMSEAYGGLQQLRAQEFPMAQAAACGQVRAKGLPLCRRETWCAAVTPLAGGRQLRVRCPTGYSSGSRASWLLGDIVNRQMMLAVLLP